MLLAVQPTLRSTKAIADHLDVIEPRLSGPAGVAMYRAISAMRNVGGRPNAETRDRMLGILERVRLLDECDTVAQEILVMVSVNGWQLAR